MPFDGQPTLRGPLVGLRPLRPADYADLYAVASDPLIWAQHPARNRHEEPVFREFFAEALASGGALLALDAGTRRVIGSSRFHGYSEERSEVEIGWTFLARSHWGGRYNGELKQLMLRHAFRFVGSVVFYVSRENARSRRAVEKIGGVLEPEPDAEGRVVYRIDSPGFAARCAAPPPGPMAREAPERLRFAEQREGAMGIEIGPLHVRRSSFMRATPERVWQEFTGFERLAAWFGRGHRLEVYEPRLGGRVLLSVEVDGAKRAYGGPILAFEPGRELTFSNNWESDGWPLPTLLTIRLTPLYDGTHVELFHHGFERLGAEAAAELEGYEAGWHSRHLEALKAIVEA